MTSTAATKSQPAETVPIPVGVIGCGRMGRLHARVYGQIPSVRLVGVFDAIHESAAAVARDFACSAFDSVEDLLDRCSAVSIAVPTSLHLSVAAVCLARRIPCLIEKPLAASVAECRQIMELSSRYDTPVQAGHIERFNPAIVAMQNLGMKPRFIDVVRVSPMTFRSTDVGVVLDMMIHDIDIVLRLAGDVPRRIEAVGLAVAGGAEDICNARLTFPDGCVAAMTASRLALKTERKLRVFSNDAYVSLNYQTRLAQYVTRTAIEQTIAHGREMLSSGQVRDPGQLDYTKLVQTSTLAIDPVEPLRAELESFIDTVRAGGQPVVSAEDGLRAVETAQRIVQAVNANPADSPSF
jgi:predicted dehydrogenase